MSILVNASPTFLSTNNNSLPLSHQEMGPPTNSSIVNPLDTPEAHITIDHPTKTVQISPLPNITNNEQTLTTRFPFPDRTKPGCRGSILISPKYSLLWLTFILTFTPIGAFLAFVYPTFLSIFPFYAAIPFLILPFLSSAACLATAWTDPGILPRNINPRSTLRMYGATDYGQENICSRLVFHEQNPDFLLGKELIINNTTVFLKYCSTCQIFRPPRSSHCSYCDNCVEEFDHHCLWVSNCVGRRNYKYFLHYLFFTAILCLSGVSTCLALVVKKTDGILLANRTLKLAYIFSWIIIVYGGLASLVILGLTIYHLNLIAKNVTTSEQIKMHRTKSPSTPRTSCSVNCARTFCQPRAAPVIPWNLYNDGKKPIDY